MTILAAIGLIGVFGLAGGSEVRSFERAAARDIASLLQGEQKTVALRTVPQGLFGYLQGRIRRGVLVASAFASDGLPLFVEPDRPQTGRLGELRLELTDFELSGLRVARLEASIPDCRFDLGLAKRERKIRLSRSGAGVGSVTVRDEAIAAFLVGKFREIRTAKVTLYGGRVMVEGASDFLIFKTPFRVIGRLQVTDGVRLDLVDARITFDGLPPTDQASATLLKAINPVIDLDRDLKLQGAIQVTQIECEDGWLTARGKATIPARRQEDP